MNKSSVSYKNIITISTDDKKSKSKSKEINPNDLNIISKNFKINLNNSLFNLRKAANKSNEKNINGDACEKIDCIIKQIEHLFNDFVNDVQDYYNKKYENILRYYERKIRVLYENIFTLELKNRILEESNYFLLRKEKEYNLIKAKTGIIVQNGKIINNNKKDNEIFILKKENSILKDTLEKQRLDYLSKEILTQRNNEDLNNKLFLKINPKNNNNKNKGALPHHSHPNSHQYFFPDYNSKLNNSLFKYKSIIYKKILKNNSYAKNNTSENNMLPKSAQKNKAFKKYVNIKIRKLCKNIKNIWGQNNNIKKTINKKNKSFNKNNINEKNNKRFSESFNAQKIKSQFIKTVNNENNSNKNVKFFQFLSPNNSNKKYINNMIPKAKDNSYFNEIKYSNSFCLKNKNIINNSSSQKKNNQDSGKIKNKKITKIIITKIDYNKLKKRNLLLNKRIKESNSKSKTNCSSNNNKSFASSKGKNNSFNNINNYINKKKK